MTEIDVALTDYGIALECAILAWLVRRGEGRRPVRRWATLFFASVGVAALIGGTVHGFFPHLRPGPAMVLWLATLLAVGVTALAAWGVGASSHFAPGPARWIMVAAILDFLAYAVIVVGIIASFTVAVLNYLAAVLFLLAVFRLAHQRRPEAPARWGAAGLGLTVVAAALQQAGVGLHPTYFNHNALYHVVQAAALLMIFGGMRWLARLEAR